jgi:mannose-1-phosphate guanylyltransferase
MISMHADHRIAPPDGLRSTLEESLKRAGEGYLCCIGVRPNRAETGYGYMQLGTELGRGSFEVENFVEKPDMETAKRYVDSGDYLWNSGIFVWHCADLFTAVEAHTHELHRALPLLSQGNVQGFFDVAQPIAIDVGVMERAGRIATTEARFEWDDLGVWTAVARSRGVDDHGNSVVGSARLLDAKRNVVWTESMRATLIGVSDMVVVEANDEILVLSRAEVEKLNLHIQKLEERDNTTPASDPKESA